MAGRDMTLQVIVRLRDELARGLDAVLGKITAWTRRVSGLFGSIGRAMGDLGAKFGALGLGSGFALGKGLQSFVDLDAKLRDVAVTYGLTGKAAEDYVATMIDRTHKLALETGQLTGKIVDVRGALAAANVDMAAAEVLVPQIARATTASRAEAGDIAAASIAAFQVANLTPDKLGTALAHMITGGKQGSFELKSQARYMPTILTAQKALGLTGMESIDTGTSMLQISKRGAGTEEEAATNYRDFLMGLNSAHTRKRFADHGVDLPGLIADANARGINPVEAVIQKVAKIIDQPKVVDKALAAARAKGLDPTKTAEEVRGAVKKATEMAGLGELFVNSQASLYLMSILANIEDYKNTKGVVAASGVGVTNADAATQMAGPQSRQQMLMERLDQLGQRLGSALTWIFDAGSKIADMAETVVKALDGVSTKIVTFGVNVGAAASAASGLAGVLALFSRGAPVAAAAAGVPAVAAAGAGGVVGRMVASGGMAGAVVAGGMIGYGAAQGVNAVADVAGGKYWAPKTDEEMGDLKARLAEIDATMERLRARSKAPDMLGPVLAPYETEAADLRNRIGAGTRAGLTAVAPPPQKVDVGGSITIRVDGPGTVTSTTSTNPQVPIGAGDRGATVGRP